MAFTNEEYEKLILEKERIKSDRMLNAINLLNSTDEYTQIIRVSIEEREENYRDTRTLVIEKYDNEIAKINIEGNSIHAIIQEYMLYVITGTAKGLYYEGYRR